MQSVWEMNVADGEGPYSTQAVEEATPDSLPAPLTGTPNWVFRRQRCPQLSLAPLSGSTPKGAGGGKAPALYTAAGWSLVPGPPGSALVGPPFLAPSLPRHPQSPRPDTCPLLPETLSARTPSSPAAEDPRLPPSPIGPSRPPRLGPGTPSHRVPPTPESARHPHFPPATRRLPVRPNFSWPRPGPGSGGESASGAATGGLAFPAPLPAQAARVALGTCSALGPRR